MGRRPCQGGGRPAPRPGAAGGLAACGWWWGDPRSCQAEYPVGCCEPESMGRRGLAVTAAACHVCRSWGSGSRWGSRMRAQSWAPLLLTPQGHPEEQSSGLGEAVGRVRANPQWTYPPALAIPLAGPILTQTVPFPRRSHGGSPVWQTGRGGCHVLLRPWRLTGHHQDFCRWGTVPLVAPTAQDSWAGHGQSPTGCFRDLSKELVLTPGGCSWLRLGARAPRGEAGWEVRKV